MVKMEIFSFPLFFYRMPFSVQCSFIYLYFEHPNCYIRVIPMQEWCRIGFLDLLTQTQIAAKTEPQVNNFFLSAQCCTCIALAVDACTFYFLPGFEAGSGMESGWLVHGDSATSSPPFYSWKRHAWQEQVKGLLKQVAIKFYTHSVHYLVILVRKNKLSSFCLYHFLAIPFKAFQNVTLFPMLYLSAAH